MFVVGEEGAGLRGFRMPRPEKNVARGLERVLAPSQELLFRQRQRFQRSLLYRWRRRQNTV